MTKSYVIKNIENGKYYTGKWWERDYAWSLDIATANMYTSEDDAGLPINAAPGENSETEVFEETPFLEVVCIYSR